VVMTDAGAWRDLDEVAWAHIRDQRFDEAEAALRRLIERAEPRDPLWRPARRAGRSGADSGGQWSRSARTVR
jgi:hypothetical protein